MFTITTVTENERTLLVLSGDGICAKLDVNDGMNLVSLQKNGLDWIICDRVRAHAGATYAVPILYPTPNRVSKDRFTFEGRTVRAKMHGCVRNRAFTITALHCSTTSARVSGITEFRPWNKNFSQFPFSSSLYITITLTQNAIRWDYTVQNDDTYALPYSFALHPFFAKNGRVFLRCFADTVMEDVEGYPTGKLIPVDNTSYDLRRFTDVETCTLDTVYCIKQAPQAEILYPDANVKIALSASSEFRRVVIYTPKNANFFCAENQTSSTNCHNLHALGYEAQANLQIVPSGEQRSGNITFTIDTLSANERNEIK